jgi:hypothetical protein
MQRANMPNAEPRAQSLPENPQKAEFNLKEVRNTARKFRAVLFFIRPGLTE